VSIEIRDFAGTTSEIEDVHARVGAVHDVDVAAVVDLAVVRLNGNLAALVGARSDTPLVRITGDGRNVVPDFPRIERIEDVERAHAGIEVRNEEHALVVDG